MYAEDELLPISALQHLKFCERQWGLIHLEQQWEENRQTAEGRLLHERAHEGGTEARPGIVVARHLHIRSLRLGLTGQADVVEFEQVEGGGPGTIELPEREGRWRPFPVEYKRGRPKPDACDEVQLCGQALCMEEMFGVTIEAGALFYGQNRRRTEVLFDAAIRGQTEDLARRMHELYGGGITPLARYSRKCESCSLYDRCLPRAPARHGAVQRYLARVLKGEEMER